MQTMTSEREQLGQAWQSYDGTAAVYDRLMVPHFFAAAANDLVALTRLPPAARLLDVGTGTGAVALAARRAVGTGGLVVGLDPSVDMLRLAAVTGACQAVAGKVPGLPFADGLFDGVAAGFVVNHCPRYENALADMVRVLGPGGRLGLTVWGSNDTEVGKAWLAVAETFVAQETLRRAVRQALPWAEWFTHLIHLWKALRDAGLYRVHAEPRKYRTTLPMADYLELSSHAMVARFMRSVLDAATWERFSARVGEALRDRFPETLELVHEVNFVVGTKPGARRARRRATAEV